MLHKLLLAAIFTIAATQIKAQIFDNPYVENVTEERVAVKRVEIQKNRTLVTLVARNFSTSDNYSFRIWPYDSPNSWYLFDPSNQKKYIQKLSFTGNMPAKDYQDMSISPGMQTEIKMVLEKLEPGVKSIDLIEGGGGSDSWSFYGIKLMSQEEVKAYIAKKKEDEKLSQEKKAKQEAERIAQAKAEQDAREKKWVEQTKQPTVALVESEKKLLNSMEALAKNRAVASIDYDGAYINAGNKYYFLKQCAVTYGRFGRCIGGYSDFDLCKTYFLKDRNNCITITLTNQKIILSGSQYVSAMKDFRVSELINFSAVFGMCVWNLETDESHSMGGSTPAWTPRFTDASLQYFNTLSFKTKTINANRAEILITDPLEKGKFYVLFNKANKFYFIFYAK